MTGPPELDCAELARRALRRGVVIERGDVYFAEQCAHRHHFRLGFAAIRQDAIRPGIARLAGVVRQLLAEAGT
jgi:GntR family transcriptional regulator/MocR family aminotransferase